MGSVTVGTELGLGRYMTAVCVEQKTRTFVWDVFDRDGGLLGRVAWYPRWRCYAFEPEMLTLFNSGCLADLRNFLDTAPKVESD